MRNWRDVIGGMIYDVGCGLHSVGLWLCGVAGSWDARTDTHKRRAAADLPVQGEPA